MNTPNRAALWIAIAALMSLTALCGCVVERDRGPYTYSYDHGDRVDQYGHREAHWCDAHHDDEHCR